MQTPMLAQHERLKRKYPGCILLFRVGDFYEGFADDAKVLSKVLGIALTGRGKAESRIPLAGIPYHALSQYLPKLIKAGHKVAIAEQMTDPEPGKLVEREVIKIITPGTIMDEKSLDPSANNYIASISYRKDKKLHEWGIAYADLSTGEFRASEFVSDKPVPPGALVAEVYRLRPAEVLLEKQLQQQLSELNLELNILDESFDFNTAEAERILLEAFGSTSLKGYGWEQANSGIVAAAKLYRYLEQTQKTTLEHIKSLSRFNPSDYMALDPATVRNLELVFPINGTDLRSTLYFCLNSCLSPMGQRLLRQWLLRPLLKKDLIEHRLNSVEVFTKDGDLLLKVRKQLEGIPDLDRIIARLGTKSANARDLVFLAASLKKLSEIFKLVNIPQLDRLIPEQQMLEELETGVVSLIDRSIREDPALNLTEGNIIKDGFHSGLDQIKVDQHAGRDYIHNLQKQEIQRTGINSLKVRYNRVFGYYIEISKSNLDKVPSDYIRKQTLVNAERFITGELKEWEEKILGAAEKAAQLEYQLFEQIRSQVIGYALRILQLSALAAEIDVLTNFAFLALNRGYCRPELTDLAATDTRIIAGRHPVVELNLNEGFINNDLEFNSASQQLLILTGPNMSGKSTFIRQNALIFLMAQTGSFVPALEAKVALADRIFTRVGAGDNLAAGESTFMVEMTETANILNNATERSLLILDEIGRGTSTYDGVAIAWAVAEFVALKLKARTLFATHYHELIALEGQLNNVANFNIEVREDKGKVSFLRKVKKGATDKSYGVYVAKLAGVPRSIIERAERILLQLEKKGLGSMTRRGLIPLEQISFAETETRDILRDQLGEIDLDNLTPLDALQKLKELQDKL
jgi:DNA mismatch repair protein MutS